MIKTISKNKTTTIIYNENIEWRSLKGKRQSTNKQINENSLIEFENICVDKKYNGHAYPHIVKDPKFYQLIKEKPFHYDEFWWKNYLDDKITEKKLKGLTEDDLIFVSSYDHTFRKLDGSIIPHAICIDYITGFSEEPKWDWDNLVEHLKKHEAVVSLEEYQIPYYNSDFYGQRGLTLVLYFEDPDPRLYSSFDRYLTSKDSPLNIKGFMHEITH